MKNIVTIGGGIAGIEVSEILSDLGYHVTLIEKENQTGGKIRKWNKLFPTLRNASDIQNFIDKKTATGNFTVLRNTKVIGAEYKINKWSLNTDKEMTINADAVVLATGFDVFDAERKEEYGYKIYENVYTSVDLEEMFKNKKQITTTDGKIPKRIALIHCVGSRDEKSGNQYCSKLCCVTGVKQAIELNELLPDTEIFCFYIDLRMYDGKFEELYRSAQEKHHIQFIRGRLSEASENIDKSLQIKAEDTLSGRPLKMTVDMLFLLVGMEPGEGTNEMKKVFGLEHSENKFIKVNDYHIKNNNSSREGIFLAGTCTNPMSVSDTLAHARSAALEVHSFLTKSEKLKVKS